MMLRLWVEVIAVLIMVAGIVGIFYSIIKHNLSLGIRTIQFLAVVFVLPVILILSLERSIGNEASAGLLGTIIGYALSGIGKGE